MIDVNSDSGDTQVLEVHDAGPGRRSRRLPGAAATVFLGLLAGACGGEGGAAGRDAGTMPTDSGMQVDAAPGCELRVGSFVAEHACLHADNGPFRTLMASAELASPEADVSQPHTAFRIELPSRQEGEGSEGAVRYTPLRSGEIALFTSPGVAIELFDEADQKRTPRIDHPALACSALAQVVTFELSQGSRYRIVFSASERTDVLLVMEALDEFLPSEAYDTQCEPPDTGSPDGGLQDAAPPADGDPLADASLPEDALTDAAPPADADCSPRIGAIVVEHTCLHATHGPFATVDAQPLSSTSRTDINASHTYYTVNLIPEDDLYTGVVSYRPTNTGPYVFFLHPDVPARVEEPDGSVVPNTHTEIITTCPGLTRAIVVELVAATRYRLVLEPSPVAAPAVAVEYLDSFLPEEQWDEPCADEY